MSEEFLSFQDVAENPVLGYYDGGLWTMGNYTNVPFRRLSEEPEKIRNNEDKFGEPDSYLVLGFRDISWFEGGKLLSREEYEKRLREHFDKRVIILSPKYYYDSKKEIYHKNASIIGESDLLPSIPEGGYLPLPTIPDSMAPSLFVSPDDPDWADRSRFTLAHWDYHLYGMPHYLLSESRDRIYVVDLEGQPEGGNYYRQNPKSKVVVLPVNINSLEPSGDCILIPDAYNVVFFSRRCLLTLSAEDKKKKEIPVSATVPQEENARPEDNGVTEFPDATDQLKGLRNYLQTRNLSYELSDLYHFHTCLTTGALTILAGMSGTGKTRLPLEYAHYFNLTEKNGQLLFVPVSPSYLEPSDLLGFYNYRENVYEPASDLASFLWNASKPENQEKIYMVVFDEMNLAPIEFYFAPFLSLLERDPSDRYLELYSPDLESHCLNRDAYPSRIRIGTNVVFLGTVNLDETTKTLSDRLLDRSFVLRLNKEKFVDLKAHLVSDRKEAGKTSEANLYDLLGPRDYTEFPYLSVFDDNMDALKFLDEFNEVISANDSQKGISYRSLKYLSVYVRNASGIDTRDAFDYAFSGTVLTKLRGGAETLSALLPLDAEGKLSGPALEKMNKYAGVSDFVRSKKRLTEKAQELARYGFCR